MDINYKFLNNSYISQVHTCWMESFKDYHVDMSYMTLERMIRRTRMDRVNFELSVGAFYNNDLIGFLLVGIDQYKSQLCAYDAGTGVIKEFRGKGITGELFNFAKPKLKFVGIEKFILEVIQDNNPAIKAYEKAGFKTCRSFNCYKLDTKHFNYIIPDRKTMVRIEPMSKSELFNHMDFLDWDVSWEYNISAIRHIKEEIIINGAFMNNKCVGFIVFYPTLNWIFMLAIDKEYRKKRLGSLLMTKLIQEIKANVNVIKFNNIIPDHEMNEFLVKHRFEIYTTQYEMEYSI